MKIASHILIVDDDVQICELVQDFLQRHGFAVSIAYNKEQMQSVLPNEKIDLVLLDVMLPGEDGFSLCKELRKESNIPIIILSALGDDTDRIVGLEIGADDYLAKPFNSRELLARIKALLRRTTGELKEERALAISHANFAELTLDYNKRCLKTREGVTVPLSVGEYDLLLVFINHPGITLSRERLLDLTREREYDPFDRSIDVQIGRLRKKIEDDPKNPKVIVTVRGGGYRFNAKVEIVKA